MNVASPVPVGFLTVYRLVLRTAPDSHRQQYADEQLALLAQIWSEERPEHTIPRVWWAISLLASAVKASIGVRVDHWVRHGRRPRGRFNLGSDLRFTLRSAARSRWYSATVIGVVAIVSVLATTTLAIVDGVLFRPLPFPEAHQLVRIMPDFEGLGAPAPLQGVRRVSGVSAVDLDEWRRAVPEVAVTGFTARRWGGLGSGVNDDSAGMAEIESNFFDVIGVRPMIGGLGPDDFERQSPVRPVLVTHQVWQGRFGGRPDIVGTEVITYPSPATGIRIVGVMPPGFVFPSTIADVSFLAPMVVGPDQVNDPTQRRIFEVVARLPATMSPGEFHTRVMPALAVVAGRFPERGPKPDGWSDATWRRNGPYDALRVVDLDESLREHAGVLFGAVVLAVALLVGVAAANVSSLMTARALERGRELAVRRSLGARGGALVRLWMLEAGTLLFAGGLAGVALAPVLLGIIVPLLPEDIVLLRSAAVDWRVGGLLVSGLALLVAAVSVAPIRRSLRASAPTDRGASERSRSRGRALVIGGQVAVAFALTVLGVSLVGSVLAVYAQRPPVAVDDVVAISVNVAGAKDASERGARIEAVRQRLKALPGVGAVAGSGAQVLRGGGALPEFTAPAGTRHLPNTDTWPVTEGFYETLAPHLVSGRTPSEDELRAAAPVLVVSETVARTLWPSANPLGQTLVNWFTKESFTVVGVVKDVRWVSWDVESPIIYAPYAKTSRYPWVTLFIRSDRAPVQLMTEALTVIRETDPLITANRAAPLRSYFEDTVALRRFQSWLFGSFAVAALVVVGAGLLGLLAMSAARRTREVGIRCALGATPGSVVGQLVREQMLAVAGGLIAGAGLAIWAVAFIKSWLYQLTPADPRIWMAALACLLVIAAIGVLIPALRASRTDPLVALRAD